MRTQDILDSDSSRRWFLDAPEAQVMSAARERELLLELAECRRSILQATRRPDGSEWALARPDAEFRRAVHGLAGVDDSQDDDPVSDGSDDGAGVSCDLNPAAVPHLARRYEEIRDALAMANSRLVAYIARRYLNRGVAPADLIQEGFCGLLEAIDRFDPVNTTRLATYASWWIRQAVQRTIADVSYPVRLTPRQLRRLARSSARSASSGGTETLTSTLSPPAHRDEAESDRETATWHELAAIRPRVSLDAVTRLGESTPLVDLIAAFPDADPETNEPAESVESLLAILNPREQLIMKLRFGLDGQPRHSLSQIGAVLTVSKERVRQIQDRALRKLRDAAERLMPASVESLSSMAGSQAG